MRFHKILRIFFLLFCFALLSNCSKQTKATKPYHNLTGRYNAFYNAQVRLDESFAMLDKQHQDNFNQLLEMYPYAASKSADAVKQPLDEALTKCARNIILHRIGNWTDNSYLLMGKAEFLLKEYEKSANSFKYITDQYHPDNLKKEEKKQTAKKKKKRKKKKRRKRKKRPKKKKTKKKSNTPNEEEDVEETEEKYGLSHRPVRHEALIWLAKSYIEMDMFDEAGFHLRQLENDVATPEFLQSEMAAVNAYLFIKQENYQEAIGPLSLAVELTKKKTVKTRYVYILAQLYQELGNTTAALDNYRLTLRLKPTYEMEFNALINIFKAGSSVNPNKTIKTELALNRMLKDSKNEEFKDRIYFSIAQHRLENNDLPGCIEALELSLLNGNDNMQRAESCLLLADLHYKEERYIKAFNYYDSTLMVLDKQDERYEEVVVHKNQLTGLAKNLAIIADKDSMLVVSSWSRKKQEAWAIANMEAEAALISPTNTSFRGTPGKDRKIDPEAKVNLPGGNSPLPNRGARNTNGGITLNQSAIQNSKFELYSPTLIKRGQKEFEKRWSDRIWAENWRRTNASSEDDSVDELLSAAATPKTQKEINAYLQKRGVPSNEAEKIKLENDLTEALYNVAYHYFEDLGKINKPKPYIMRLYNQFDSSSYTVEALFLGYSMNYAKNEMVQANYYKNIILSKYPDSNIAKLLRNPDFLKGEQERYLAINALYDQTYDLIKKGQSNEALKNVKSLKEKFGANYEMKARFALLEAMCMGALKGEKEYIRALKIVITSFPDTDEEKQAKLMLTYLSGKDPNKEIKPIDISSNVTKVPYVNKMETKHIVLLVFKNRRTKVNQFRGTISDFNSKHFPNDRLNISTILIDGKLPSVTIRSFTSGKKAMEYVTFLKNDPTFLGGLSNYDLYAISQQNYNIALSTQNFRSYPNFFNENYK